MRAKKVFLLFSALVLSHSVQADPAIYDGWQWNNNVKVDYIYTYETTRRSYVHMDNGEFCYVEPSEKILFAAVLAMRAQQTVGQLVCHLGADDSVDGIPARHIHRLRH